MFILKHHTKLSLGITLGLGLLLVLMLSLTYAEDSTLLPQKFSINPALPNNLDPMQFSETAQLYKTVSVALPASFDLRTTVPARVTPVKDQSTAKTDWAFATMSSLESSLLPAETWDFSENNLKNNNKYSFSPNYSMGNHFVAIAYLARWDGPVSEADDPYSNNTITSPPGLTVRKHLQNVYLIPDRNTALIKQTIMNYGAVYTTMYWDDVYNCYNSINHAYYEPRTYWNTYYHDNLYYNNNHAVAIVGWDDNFPRINFKADGNSIPAGNGAWIVKDSRGTDWGESGYFYLSYYDNNTPRGNAVFLKPEATDNYKRIYQYDPLGLIYSGGFGSTTAWMANIFTTAASEPLVAISFYTRVANSSYTIKIYNNGSSLDPVSGTLACTKTGVIPNAGYHTISLNPTPVMLTAGQNFSVVIKLTTPSWNYPIPIEATDSSLSAYPTTSNRSYISPNGTRWANPGSYVDSFGHPIFENSDCCIKAFTRTAPTIAVQPVGQTVDAESNPTFTVTAVGSPNPAYQWYFGESLIEGAISPTLTLNNVSPANNGEYSVVVTNSEGMVTSQKATLTVNPLLPPPLLDLPSGVYSTPQNVSVFYPQGYPGVTIRYTLDGKEPIITSPVFSQTAPLKIAKTTTLKARAWLTGYTTSHTTTASCTITGIVATPSFSLPSGAYTTSTTVSLKCALPVGAIIRYTTNGSDPTDTSLQYTGPITITTDMTLKAKAWFTDWETSATATATYTVIKIANPTFSIAGGIYPSTQTVLIKCTTPGVTIRYTIDDSIPSRTNGIIGTTVPIKTNCTLQAIAYRTGYTDSGIVSAIYNIGKVMTPVFNLPSTKIYHVSNSVSINCATTDAIIHYTIDGSTPNDDSPVYSAPIPLDHPMVIKAIAFKTYMVSSTMASVAYNVYLPATPAFDIVANTYTSEQTVTITCVDPDAVIRYTTTGSPPTATSPSIKSGGVVQIGKTMTLMAKAFKTGWTPSDTMMAKYTIQTFGTVKAPTFNPLSGTCAIGNTIAINGPPGAEIRYTKDGTIPTGRSDLYKSEFPILFTEPLVIKAKAFITGMASSAVATGTYNAILPQPAFSSGTGTYGEQIITISCDAVPDATIRYTTNGSEPIATSPIAVGGTVLINKSMTLKAKAFKTGWLPSPTQTATYTVTQVATPVFSVAEGIYTTTQRILISCATTGAAIRYTTDGNDPTVTSPVYPATGITISATKTLKAFAIKTGMTNSNIKAATYTITGKVATPTFYCMSNNVRAISATFASGIWVYLNCTTEGAEIHYTTNNKEPTINDPAVAPGSSLLFEASVILKAKAFKGKDTWLPSNTQTATYTIIPVTTPQLTLDAGMVTVACATPGAIIRYTVNGNEPTLTDPVISSGIKISLSPSAVLKAKAWKVGLAPSRTAVIAFNYQLNVTTSENGSTTPEGKVTVDEGAITTITATPATGCHFVNWTKTGGTGTVIFSNSNAISTTVKVTGGDATIQANFAVNQYNLIVANDGNGSNVPLGIVKVMHGIGTNITATPTIGYHFVNWTQTSGSGTAVFDDADSAGTKVTVTGGDATVRANFVVNQYTLTVTNDGNGGNTPEDAVTVNNGEVTPITATPNTGYHFDKWTKTAGTGIVVFGNVYSPDTTVSITGGDAAIQANFTDSLLSLGSTPFSLSSYNGGNIYSLLTAQPASKPEANGSPGTKYSFKLSSTSNTSSYSPNIQSSEEVSPQTNNLVFNTAMTDWDKVLRQKENDILSKRYTQFDGVSSGKYIMAAPAKPVVGTAWNAYIAVTERTIATTCRFISNHAYIFVDNRDNMSAYLADYGTAFDAIYDTDASKFGTVNDVDRNAKVIIIFSRELSQGLLGYFYGADKYPKATYSDSNEGDIFYVTTTAEYQGDTIKGTLAHELQHMIYFDEHYNRGVAFTFTWLNEALSQAAEYYNGYVSNHNAWMNNFLHNNWSGLSLTHWTSNNYGYGALFIRYLIDQYGDTAIKNMCSTDKIGIRAVEAATGTDFNDIFYDFSRALVMSGTGDCNPRYRFNSLDLQTLQPVRRSGLTPFGYYYAGNTINNSIYPYELCFNRLSGNFGTMTLTGDSITGTAFGFYENTLTVTKDEYGSTIPSDTITIYNNVSRRIIATPDPGCRFTHWTKTDGTGTVVFGDANSADTTVTVTGGNATIHAGFNIDPTLQYTLTVTDDGHGSTAPSGTLTITNGVSTPITANPGSGYIFVNWTKTAGTGRVVFDNASSANTTVTVIGGDATIKANFLIPSSLNTWITGNITAGGSKWYVFPTTIGTHYKIQWDELYGSGKYNCNIIVSAYQTDLTTSYFSGVDYGYSYLWTITAQQDYVHVLVKGFASSSAGSFAIKVTPDYYLTINNDGHGFTNPSGTSSINGPRAITATPNTGYRFSNWTKTAGAGTTVFGNANSASTTVTVTGGDATIQANFSVDQTIPYTLTITNNGGGTTTPSGATTVYNGVSTPITATVNPNCHFKNWTKTGGTGTVVFGDANAADTTVTIINGNATIQAVFMEPLSLDTWTIGNITAGNSKWYVFQATTGTQYSINWDDLFQGSHTYNCDVRVTAYQQDLTTAYFTRVDSGYYSPQIITAQEDYIYILVEGYSSNSTGSFAIRVGPPQYILTITSEGQGITAPSGNIGVIAGISTPIIATPNSGYKFVNWSKVTGIGTVEFGNVGSANTTAILTGGSATIRANFILDQTIEYTMTVTNIGDGSTTPSGPVVVNNGTSTTITATPSTNFINFINWTKVSGNGTVIFADAYAASTVVTIIGGDATIQANFMTLPTMQNIIAIDDGSYHCIALRSDRTVWTWGNNEYGQLGNGTNKNNIPVQICNLTDVIAIAGGANHSLAVRSDGTVWAWGHNQYGQLGNGTNTNSNIPVQVSNLTNVIAISSNSNHSLALKNDGTVWAWGYNSAGQLGNGTYLNSNIPVQVYNLSNIIAIACSLAGHNLALKSDGTVWAWGNNTYGQLGIGTYTISNIPVQISNLTNIIAITAGSYHCLALKNDGTVWAWGCNQYGQLGNGTTNTCNIPIQVNIPTNVIAIAGGYNHSLALKNDGTVWAWGYNFFGELGNGTTTDSKIPVQVSNLTNIIAISGGGYDCSYALKNDGTAWAWGLNFHGGLGDGTVTNSRIPVQVGRPTPAGNPYQFALTITNDGYGTTTPVGTMTVNGDSSTTITATANTGYQFLHWIKTGGAGTVVFGDPNAANATVTVVGGNATVQAFFTEQ